MEKTELHEILTLNRVFAVAPETVWRAWIDADALRVWFGQSEAPGWEALLDVRVGGRYHLVIRHPRGFYYQVRGVYREVVPPTSTTAGRLAFTWNQEGELAECESLITVELRARSENEGGGTQLSFTQDPMFDPQARDGWRADFKRLGKFFQDGGS
jgi:uncharacterized protein YndB with AHSA1/START domain